MSSMSDDVTILDGGLATELERRNVKFLPRLWSASALLDERSREKLTDVHRDYVNSGAMIISTATYQLSYATLEAEPFSMHSSEIDELVRLSVRLARRAAVGSKKHIRIGGSIGSYGAALADGSEYTGRYGRPAIDFGAFHEQRIRVLADEGVDLLLVETMPRVDEALAVLRIARRFRLPTIVSFCCQSADSIADGTSFASAVQALLDDNRDACESDVLLAVGANCCAPQLIGPLLASVPESVRRRVKSFAVYPNSGECWDAEAKRWCDDDKETAVSTESLFADNVHAWIKLGARIIGGCCRTTPSHIEFIKRIISE
jgi:homocysteine S-methyltransferase